ncbi:MAG: DamX protein [Candidatus Azotimanducaceae bacterium]|jgi:DamX protein
MGYGMSDIDIVVNLGGQSARSADSRARSGTKLGNQSGRWSGSEFVGNGESLNLPDKLACLATYGEMYILVSGGSGQGKSLVKTQMLAQLAEFLPVLELNAEQRSLATLTEALLVGFSLNATRVGGNAGLDQLRRFTRDLANSSRKAVVVVDNAHCLTNAALKTLLDLVEKAGLGLVLFAEPSIDRRNALKAVAARIYRCSLNRLDKSQARSYLRRKQPGLTEGLNQAQLDDILVASRGVPSEIDRRLEDILHEPRPARGLPMIHVSMILALVLMGGAALWFEQGAESIVTRQSLAIDTLDATTPAPFGEGPSEPSGESSRESSRESSSESFIQSLRPTLQAAPTASPKGPDLAAAAQPEASAHLAPPVVPGLSRNVSLAVIMPRGAPSEMQESTAPSTPLNRVDKSITTQRAATQAGVAALVSDPTISLSALNADAADWIYSARPGEYTLQLMGSYSLDGIEAFINSTGEPERFAYFVTRRGSAIWYVLTAGRYRSRDAAVAAINALPPSLADTKPWARSVESIRGSLGS